MNREFKRMQELAGLDEIKVEKPVSNKDLLDKMTDVDEYGDSLIEQLAYRDTFDEWADDQGLDEEDPNDAEAIKLGKAYFNWVSRGDIFVFRVQDDEGENNIVFPKPYKKAITYGLGYNDVRIILHNF